MAATTGHVRSKLRDATFIIPRTGERVKKSITLHKVNGNDGPADVREPNDTTSLLQAHDHGTDGPVERYGVWPWTRDIVLQWKEFQLSQTGKGVLKCSIAYLLGSLATFVPVLSHALGKQDGKHLIATITVYFHPARSIGSMFNALVLAFAAFLYMAFVSLTSMSVSVLFADTLDMMSLGHAVVLVVFVGGGLGLVGWVKLKIGDSLVNVACSLTSLGLITVLTKEGAVQRGDYSFTKIAQVLEMIVVGILATMTVSFCICPISARRTLKQNMVDITNALAEMLALTASSFLSGDEKELEADDFAKANHVHQKAFATLGKNLKEAKYEHYVFGTERQYHVEARLVQCVQRISQSIGGLRSAATMQFSVLKQPNPPVKGHLLRTFESAGSVISTTTRGTTLVTRTPSVDLNGSIWAAVASSSAEEEVPMDSREQTVRYRGPGFRTPSQIFELFIDHLGPSMRSLAFTMKEILDALPYDPNENFDILMHPKFRVSLQRALEVYKLSRDVALKLVYDQKDINRMRPFEVEADWEEAAASCGHFSFSLLDVAEQLNEYLIILDELQLEIDELSAGTRTWLWIKFWQSSRNRFSNIDPDLADLIARADDLGLQVEQPKMKAQRPGDDSLHSKKQSATKQLFFRRVYQALWFLRRDDIKFAVKVGAGAAIYALPSFLVSTRPIYSHWRGEWGLLSYMLVCSMTIGASNTTGFSRFLGTCLGALLAIAAWEVSNENPYILAFFGFCMAYWTAYLIVGKGKGPMGRFIMLTYNLSALYAYSLSVKDDENDGDEEDSSRHPLIFSIAKHRVVAVLSGCLWGLVVTRLVWPISARQKLKHGLSLLWLRMGLIWKRDPLAMFLDEETPNESMNIREESSLQRFHGQLTTLVESAKSEFDLKGPFPDKVFSKMLLSTGRMLDAFHTMNSVIMKSLHATPGEQALLKSTVRERAELCSRISHLFTVLASTMKLEYAIPGGALPNTDNARDRLLAKMFVYRKLDAEQQGTSDQDFELFYTYSLCTAQLGIEIQGVLAEMEVLFGALDEESLHLQ